MADLDIVQGQECTFIRNGKPIKKFVPLSEETCVLIPSNLKGTGFLKNLFKPNREYLGGLIERKKFNKIVENCMKIAAKAYSHNRKKDVEGISTLVILLLILSSALMLCFVFLLYYGIRDDSRD